MPDKSLTELIRIYFKAYETKDQSALESTFSDDFIFTSPCDDHIDRAFTRGDGGKIKTIEVYFESKIGRVEDIK